MRRKHDALNKRSLERALHQHGVSRAEAVALTAWASDRPRVFAALDRAFGAGLIAPAEIAHTLCVGSRDNSAADSYQGVLTPLRGPTNHLL